jgi:hypothetical protein
MLKLYECDVSLTIRGQTYVFTHIRSVTFEDPAQNNLTRGANEGNKIGVAFKEGITEPVTITPTVIAMPASLHNLLKDVFKKAERITFEAISRKDGSSAIANNALLANYPRQLNLDETAESMDTVLILKSFDVEENHKGTVEGEEA